MAAPPHNLLATCALLAAHQRLQALTLRHCGLSGSGAAQALGGVLAGCSALRSLDVSANRWASGARSPPRLLGF